MADSFSKKENKKKKARKKQDKAQKREERKSNNDKGKSLEDMMAYVDENGNLSTVDPSKIEESPTDKAGKPQDSTSKP